MKKIILGIYLILFSATGFAGISLSDLAQEELREDMMSTGNRNIFTSSEMEGNVDVTSLTLEGLLFGKNTKLILLSGRILREGEHVGRYFVSSIEPGKIILTSADEQHIIKMDNYVSPLQKQTATDSSVELRNADIKDALRLLAIASGYNLIAPEDIQGRVNLTFENTPILTVIRAILKVNNYHFAIENGIMRVGKPEQFQGGTDLLATTFRINYAKAKDLVPSIKLLLSDKGSASSEDRINVVSVKDYDANIESVRQLIAAVDRKDQQVEIEAHIVNASNDFSRALGVKWGITGTPGRIDIAGGDTSGTITIGSNAANPAHVNLPAANPTGGAGFRIGSLPGATNIDLQFSAAEERGDIKIISKPTVTTINNQPAKIRSGLTIHVKANSDINFGSAGGTSGSSTTSNLKAIETGVELKVTPQISPNNLIKLIIEATESEADFSKTVDGIPAIIDNVATTTILLKHGETAVLGGLLKRKDTLKRKRVPGFSNIPVLGNFFKSRTKTNTYNELMIFITPRVIN